MVGGEKRGLVHQTLKLSDTDNASNVADMTNQLIESPFSKGISRRKKRGSLQTGRPRGVFLYFLACTHLRR